MKKLAFFLLAMAFAYQYSYAQNSNPWPTSGNVGIGTTNPTLGNLQIDGINADLLSLNGINASNAVHLNAYNNNDFRIVQRSNSPLTLWTNTIERMRITPDGNIGIGLASPSAKLHVFGGFVRFEYNSATNPVAEFTNGIDANLDIIVGNGGASDKKTFIGPTTNINLVLGQNNTEAMRISAGGNISIGTTDSHGYKLAVNGDIRSKKIVVESGPWPDYVFKPTYNLRPLSEVKTYIDQNRHLPEIPSAAEAETQGQDLGEMNKLLLKKLEEVTLYLVQKDEQLKQLQDEVNELKTNFKTITSKQNQ